MPCLEYLTEFTKVYQFGTDPPFISVLNYDSDQIQHLQAPPELIKAGLHCANGIKLKWLNKKGGWETFVFSGNHSYSFDISKGVVYQSESGQENYSGRGQIRNRIACSSQFLPKADKEAILGVVKSIQVFWYSGNAIIPVIVDEGEYLLYKDGDSLQSLNFSFTVSQLERVQTA